MDLLEIHERFNDLLGKAIGEYFTPQQIDRWLDMAQLALYNDYYLIYAKSQRIVDALAPFKKKFMFTLATTPGGVLDSPDDYFDAVSITTVVQDATGRVSWRPCPRLNENEIANRRNSQVIPLSLFDPFCETINDWDLQFYPQQGQAGILSYLSDPPAPKMIWSSPGGVFTYDPVNSIQMAWADKDITSIILKAVDYSGLNVREQDVQAWASRQDQQNILTPDKA